MRSLKTNRVNAYRRTPPSQLRWRENDGTDVEVGFTEIYYVKLTIAFSAAFVTVRVIRDAILNQSQFACHAEYRARSYSSL